MKEAERPERVEKVKKPVAVTSREAGTVTRNEDAVPGRTECTDGTDLVPGDPNGTVTEATGWTRKLLSCRYLRAGTPCW
ncbi:hypothetical protein DVH05_017193 [Phytophthora capsici]|nr:hypothetical protein DVH05_017193 [Phytophthora capsici]